VNNRLALFAILVLVASFTIPSLDATEEMTRFSFVNMPVDRKWIAIAVVCFLVIGSITYLLYNQKLQ